MGQEVREADRGAALAAEADGGFPADGYGGTLENAGAGDLSAEDGARRVCGEGGLYGAACVALSVCGVDGRKEL